MVVTRGFVYPHIKFAMSTLADAGLWYEKGESHEEASKNWKRYFEDKKIPVNAVHFMQQVHGKNSHDIEKNSEVVISNVDSLISTTRGSFIAVKSADCLPIMLFDPKRNIVAAIHSGWRGTKEQIVKHVVEKLIEQGSDVQNIHAILCPAIGVCCYDVTGADDGRIEDFEKLFGANGVENREGKTYLNIRKANIMMLEEMGVPKDHIVDIDECTSCGVMKLPSYFRTKTNQRFVSVIGIV